jgi:hypothetical protein
MAFNAILDGNKLSVSGITLDLTTLKPSASGKSIMLFSGADKPAGMVVNGKQVKIQCNVYIPAE